MYVLSVISRSERARIDWAVLMDSPTSPISVAFAWRNECHETRGKLNLSQAGASARLYRFLGLRGVPLLVQKTRSSSSLWMQATRYNSRTLHKAELIGITRLLLRVFGLPNCPSEYVSDTSMFPRRKSRRFHLSARISLIRTPVSTAVSTTVRQGSVSFASTLLTCEGVRKARGFLDCLSPIWMPPYSTAV